jgi:cyclohexa-1,5-dienecarbonyl-CoA hydratase
MSVSTTLSADQSSASLRFFHAKGNILTEEIITDLRAALETLTAHPHLKLVTIAGEGPDFSFGASIPEHMPELIGRVLPLMDAFVQELLEVPSTTAAVVRGRCLGGGFEIALACDLIFAAENAVFGLPEVALGVFPPAASALLPLRAGYARATEFIVSGRSVGAAEMESAGLVQMVAADADLAQHVDEWFERHLRPKSAAALRHAAAAARFGLAAHVRATLPALEQIYLDDLMRTHDAVEGVRAFLDKRPPTWLDR